MIQDIFSKINAHVYTLNDSKYFAGIMMILLNVGSKFITIQFSKSTEEYIKFSVTKQIVDKLIKKESDGLETWRSLYL